MYSQSLLLYISLTEQALTESFFQSCSQSCISQNFFLKATFTRAAFVNVAFANVAFANFILGTLLSQSNSQSRLRKALLFGRNDILVGIKYNSKSIICLISSD
ncbi:hypothetical protein SDC9_128578 [bioreactor metagenome]|uniref:Uncharacterized protein n=1 Tax=bioreactor metagenome TaxID=1076179 RepID=A0A645CXE7_9ZZZZ